MSDCLVTSCSSVVQQNKVLVFIAGLLAHTHTHTEHTTCDSNQLEAEWVPTTNRQFVPRIYEMHIEKAERTRYYRGNGPVVTGMFVLPVAEHGLTPHAGHWFKVRDSASRLTCVHLGACCWPIQPTDHVGCAAAVTLGEDGGPQRLGEYARGDAEMVHPWTKVVSHRDGRWENKVEIGDAGCLTIAWLGAANQVLGLGVRYFPGDHCTGLLDDSGAWVFPSAASCTSRG